MTFAIDVHFFLSLVRNPGDRKDAIRWWRLRSPGSPMTAGIPWIAFGAIDFLQRRDLSGARVFEWGSGGSTLCRSLDELAGTDEFREMLHHEFPDAATEWDDGPSRRNFL